MRWPWRYVKIQEWTNEVTAVDGTLKSKNEPADHTRVSNVPAALSNTRVPRTHASVGGAFSPGVSFLSGGKKGSRVGAGADYAADS